MDALDWPTILVTACVTAIVAWVFPWIVKSIQWVYRRIRYFPEEIPGRTMQEFKLSQAASLLADSSVWEMNLTTPGARHQLDGLIEAVRDGDVSPEAYESLCYWESSGPGPEYGVINRQDLRNYLQGKRQPIPAFLRGRHDKPAKLKMKADGITPDAEHRKRMR